MGASAWSYWIEWQGSPEATLDALLQRELEAGNYVWERRGKRPKTIAALVKRAAESGTHSILDIRQVGARRAHGVAASLSADQLDALFGTDMPSRTQVDAEATLIGHLRERGEGTYIIAFEEREPVAVYFCGFSGD